MSRKRIAVLEHAFAPAERLGLYVVQTLATLWREDGYEVVFLRGTQKRVDADAILVHVDLSVVPDEYLAFAATYPRVLNGSIRDIRKSVLGLNRVQRGDGFDGPVMVKSNLNCRGLPEFELAVGRSVRWLGPQSFLIVRALRWIYARTRARQYRVYASPADVPLHAWTHPWYVVERFLPEIEDGGYCLRMYSFLGDRGNWARLTGPVPVLKGDTCSASEPIEPDAEVLALRRKYGMDYGKLDYVVRDGHAVLLDVNKTTGASRRTRAPTFRPLHRNQAEGLYCYFD
jgi:hypothetical protein